MDINILIIGGDSRIDYLMRQIICAGYKVKKFSDSDTLKGALDDCDVVLLGLPASRDDKTVDAPDLKESVLIKDLMRLMGENKLLLAGKMSERMKAVADVFSVRWIDYFMRDELEILNAIPTCEGAIQIAMEELPVTLHSSKTVITGYGRIGKLLAKELGALGADVTVCARKLSARAQARADGFKAIDFKELKENMKGTTVLFNTVPHRVIDRSILLEAKAALIIDLASKPGGVDMDAARDAGVKVVWALGLPGKVAPLTAANIIKETIYNIFNELGE